MSRSCILSCSCVLTSLALAACGGAGVPPPAAAPQADTAGDEREPTSIAEAQDQIDRARAALEARPGAAAEETPAAEHDAVREPEAAPSTDAAGPRQERSVSPADACASSCRALSSMRRAVTALCRMTGQEDARCSEAKRTLDASASRAATCTCAP